MAIFQARRLKRKNTAPSPNAPSIRGTDRNPSKAFAGNVIMIPIGIKNVIIPKSNEKDIVLSQDQLKKVTIIPLTTIKEVLKEVLDWSKSKEFLKKLDKTN